MKHLCSWLICAGEWLVRILLRNWSINCYGGCQNVLSYKNTVWTCELTKIVMRRGLFIIRRDFILIPNQHGLPICLRPILISCVLFLCHCAQIPRVWGENAPCPDWYTRCRLRLTAYMRTRWRSDTAVLRGEVQLVDPVVCLLPPILIYSAYP